MLESERGLGSTSGVEAARGLRPAALQALADLERRVLAADGGRLKLEWGTLRSRTGSRVEDLLFWAGGELVGFLGLYGFGGSLELTGMVAPDARRRGIATALLDAALPLCASYGNQRPLLIVPRPSVPGRCLALTRGGVLDSSEYALALDVEPSGGASDPAITLRRAVPADAAQVSRLLHLGFGHRPTDLTEQLASDRDRTLLIERAGSPVGTLRVARDGSDAGIYGFVVDPAWRGRGVGRDVLRRVCQQERADGVRRITLEVAVDNEHALGLYTSVGFVPYATEDYYALPIG